MNQFTYIFQTRRAHQREKSSLNESHLNTNRSVGRRYLEDRRFFFRHCFSMPGFSFQGHSKYIKLTAENPTGKTPVAICMRNSSFRFLFGN